MNNRFWVIVWLTHCVAHGVIQKLEFELILQNITTLATLETCHLVYPIQLVAEAWNRNLAEDGLNQCSVSHGRLKHNTKVWDRDETLRAKLPWHCSPRRRQRHGFMDVKSSPSSSPSCKPGCCLLYIGGIYEMFELYLIAWVGKCWGKLL